MFRFLQRIITTLTFSLLVLALIGQLLRDQTLWLAWLMYLPLILLGLWAVFWDVQLGGRSLSPRYSLLLLGLLSTVWALYLNWGQLITPLSAPPSQTLTLLHWNVRWGGRIPVKKWFDKKPWNIAWASIRDNIVTQAPDIIVLSEPPQYRRLPNFAKQLSKNWLDEDWRIIQFKPAHPCRYNCILFAILSPFPMQLENYVKVRNGDAFVVKLNVDKHTLRILVVDGLRDLTRMRMLLLSDLAAVLRDYHLKGQTIDIVAGDFNALGRSRGFDVFPTLGDGLWRASDYYFGWRGTWLFPLPLYDIDHVWLSQRFKPVRVDFLASFASDHRGQVVEFAF